MEHTINPRYIHSIVLIGRIFGLKNNNQIAGLKDSIKANKQDWLEHETPTVYCLDLKPGTNGCCFRIAWTDASIPLNWVRGLGFLHWIAPSSFFPLRVKSVIESNVYGSLCKDHSLCLAVFPWAPTVYSLNLKLGSWDQQLLFEFKLERLRQVLHSFK